ncbi:hypothetical protein AB0M28_31425 [Streptomyces sp. NPDC051940]|uniref:hypothetical protein n=1 Tax=Streptomyces sp. NPDC051940 TaxID=3155675 RepID=UPI00344A92C7
MLQLACPHAVSAVLLDGRVSQLPGSEVVWKYAAVVRDLVSSPYGDDKYDAAYERAEQEANSFGWWEHELGEGGR